MKREVARKLLRAAMFAGYFFVCFELLSRAVFWVNPLFRVVSGRDDASFRIAWVKRHIGRQAFLSDSDYWFLKYDRTRSWSLKPNIRDGRVFGQRVLNTNSIGARGVREYLPTRTPGTRRIMVLGDSYSFGDEVSDDETYSHYLESLLPNTEVLDFGLSGYGHDQMLITLQEEGPRYRPDVVMLGWVWFDKYRNLRSFNDYAKPRFERVGNNLLRTGVPVPTPDEVLAREPYRLKTFDVFTMLREKFRWTFGVNRRNADDITRLILDQIRATARDLNATLVIAYLPVMDEMVNTSKASSEEEQYLENYCHDRGQTCMFLRPGFREAVEHGQNFNTRVHWQANAHWIAAQEMRDFLESNHVLGDIAQNK